MFPMKQTPCYNKENQMLYDHLVVTISNPKYNNNARPHLMYALRRIRSLEYSIADMDELYYILNKFVNESVKIMYAAHIPADFLSKILDDA